MKWNKGFGFKILWPKIFLNKNGGNYFIYDLFQQKCWNARKNRQKELCKFYSLSNPNHIEAIENKFWFSSAPKSFNDVLDCNPRQLTYRNIIKQTKSWTNQVGIHSIDNSDISNCAESAQFDLYNNFSGVTCFSHHKNILNHLMWSHYASQHSGICFLFKNVQPQQNPFSYLYQYLLPVAYLSKNPKLNEQHVLFLFPFIKSSCWKYEQEYRLVANSGIKPLSVNDRKLGFSSKNVSAIYFGYRFMEHENHQKVLETIYKKYSKIKLYQIDIKPINFKLTASTVQLKFENEKYMIIKNYLNGKMQTLS